MLVINSVYLILLEYICPPGCAPLALKRNIFLHSCNIIDASLLLVIARCLVPSSIHARWMVTTRIFQLEPLIKNPNEVQEFSLDKYETYILQNSRLFEWLGMICSSSDVLVLHTWSEDMRTRLNSLTNASQMLYWRFSDVHKHIVCDSMNKLFLIWVPIWDIRPNNLLTSSISIVSTGKIVV